MMRIALAAIVLFVATPSDAASLAFSSRRIEAVAVVGAQQLDVYVDDWQSNAPLTGLDVRIQSAGASVALRESAPGVYSAPLLAPFADQPIRLQIQGAGWAEIFSGRLPVAR